MRSVFEEMCGTYTLVGDVFLPDIELPDEEDIVIGAWGQRHLLYLKEHRRGLYETLVIKGTLRRHLADIEREAQSAFLRLVNEMAEREGVSEQLKVDNWLEWLMRMNNINNRAREIVDSEIIFS